MAITGVLGDTLRTSISHFAPDNSPILGASFAAVVANRPDDTTFPVTFEEIGSGVYEASVATAVTDAPGEWFLLVEADNGYRYEETFDIAAYQDPVVVEVPSVPQTGATRRQLRLAVAQMLGDLTLVVATADGTESMVVDEINLQRELNAFNGMQAYCAATSTSVNLGKLTTVVSNNPSARTINFVPPLPYLTRRGDVFELYNYRDNGWRFDEYNRAINDAILRGGEENGNLPYTEVVATPFSRSYNLVTIPSTFSHFSGIDVMGRDGVPRKVPYNMYEIDRHTGELSIKGSYLSRAHGQTLRIRGFRQPDLLHADDQRTHMPSEWIIHEASAVLLQGDVVHGVQQGERSRILNMERGGADGRRPSILTTYPPNTVKLARG